MTTLAFLDANILAEPFTRTLLMVGAGWKDSSYAVTWSNYAETEAQRHLRPHTTPLIELRARYNIELSPTGAHPERYPDTDVKDRQILSDTVTAHAVFLITENVTDFAYSDLDDVGVSAVHFDLFLANWLDPNAYREALNILAFNRYSPESIHAAAARLHPMLFEAQRSLFPDVEPELSQHNYPTELFRGTRCVRCGKPTDSTVSGLCQTCAAEIA